MTVKLVSIDEFQIWVNQNRHISYSAVCSLFNSNVFPIIPNLIYDNIGLSYFYAGGLLLLFLIYKDTISQYQHYNTILKNVI